MTQKKKYQKPSITTTLIPALCSPLCNSNTDPVPVDPGKEGDQTGAESRRKVYNVWGEEEFSPFADDCL